MYHDPLVPFLKLATVILRFLELVDILPNLSFVVANTCSFICSNKHSKHQRIREG